MRKGYWTLVGIWSFVLLCSGWLLMSSCSDSPVKPEQEASAFQETGAVGDVLEQQVEREHWVPENPSDNSNSLDAAAVEEANSNPERLPEIESDSTTKREVPSEAPYFEKGSPEEDFVESQQESSSDRVIPPEVAVESPNVVDSSGLPYNQWIAAKAKYLLPKIPHPGWNFGDEYCASMFRSKTNTVLFRSGVLTKVKKPGVCRLWPGYYSNAMMEWNPRTNEVRPIDIFNWGGGSGGGGCLLPNFTSHPSPSPRHTYDGMAYVPKTDTVYLVLGATWKIQKNATKAALSAYTLDMQSTWKYVISKKRWYRIKGNVRALFKKPPFAYQSHLRYWAKGNRLLFVDSEGKSHAEFDLTTETWKEVKAKQNSPCRLNGARSAWDSKRDVWLFRANKEVCSYDPSTRSYKRLPDTDVNHTNITYLSKYDLYLVAGPTGDDTRIFDPKTNKWRSLKGGAIKLPNGYLEFDPLSGLVLMVRQSQTFWLRFRP